jgi:hypothetical protein
MCILQCTSCADLLQHALVGASIRSLLLQRCVARPDAMLSVNTDGNQGRQCGPESATVFTCLDEWCNREQSATGMCLRAPSWCTAMGCLLM